VDEASAYGGPVLIGPLSARFTVVQKAVFAREALAVEGAAYLTIQIHGAASVPSVAEKARVDISLPWQAFVLPRPGVSVMTFKLWDETVTRALQSVLVSGQTSGGRVLSWYVWNHDAELVESHGWDRPDPVAAACPALGDWVAGLWRQGVMRSGTRTAPGTLVLAAVLLLALITGSAIGLYVLFW